MRWAGKPRARSFYEVDSLPDPTIWMLMRGQGTSLRPYRPSGGRLAGPTCRAPA